MWQTKLKLPHIGEGWVNDSTGSVHQLPIVSITVGWFSVSGLEALGNVLLWLRASSLSAMSFLRTTVFV